MRVFPNPASEIAEVTFNEVQGAATMEVVDMRGATVMHKVIGTTGNAPAVERIDVSQWDAGVYQVLLTDAKGGRSTRRFIVAH
ncbi:MAG: T9SS type A sorting domain-containing protein [Flavobacteriales bacterium]|nr:T9SS type A sorting domain-containing protein [Flavobacteriales bacterium]